MGIFNSHIKNSKAFKVQYFKILSWMKKKPVPTENAIFITVPLESRVSLHFPLNGVLQNKTVHTVGQNIKFIKWTQVTNDE